MSDRIDNILNQQVELTLIEDVGPGDITTLACIESKQVTAKIIAKSDGVLSGYPVASAAFRQLDANMILTAGKNDGEQFAVGDTIMAINGDSHAVLTSERTALNFMGHLSGIASLTAQFVEEVKGTSVKILDTRKTTPGLRYLEKYAVSCGGGVNHRFGLFDMALIKDNHISACGSITSAVKKMREFLDSPKYMELFSVGSDDVEIEVEIKNENELIEAIDCGITRILLDNQTPKQLIELVKIARTKSSDLILEASGNVSISTLNKIAATGVDVISCGALTHQARSVDMSMRIVAD